MTLEEIKQLKDGTILEDIFGYIYQKTADGIKGCLGVTSWKDVQVWLLDILEVATW